MEISKFKVYHNGKMLGEAKLVGKRASYKTDKAAYPYFEQQEDCWLKEFRAVVYKLAKSIGHWSKYSISEDTVSGIRLERQ